MIIEAGLAVSVVAAGYYAYKHYGTAAIVAAVKAEVAKAEANLPTLEAAVKAEVSKVVSAIKAKL